MIIVNIPDIIAKVVDQEDIDQLIEAIEAFASIGLIDVDDNNEVNVTAQLMQDIILGTERINDASKKYSLDDDGLVNYPFWGVA